MILKDYLLEGGFEQKLPWQFHSDGYMIVHVGEDSYEIEVWSITNKRYDEVVFRGRVTSVEEFKRILLLVKEDYNLTDNEVESIKK